MLYAAKNCMIELAFSSVRNYRDPYGDIDLNVTFTGPGGREWIVPAFWAGENAWKVRFAGPETGRYRYTSECSDATDTELHRKTGSIEVSDYTGNNPLLLHGRLRVSTNRRHLEHADGTPFFWLGDTWWMGLCGRLSWPEDFQLLAADRVKKGFNVIQIVAGLYPDMPPFDPRGANEAGYPIGGDYGAINPAYFDMADLRLSHLVRSGLVPCLVACWGYFLNWMGTDKVKRFWRYLVARYGAYPMVWCIAGEPGMSYYLSPTAEDDSRAQRRGWTEVAAYVRQVDPFHNPVTSHCGHDTVEDASLLDLDMLANGHDGKDSIPAMVKRIVEAVQRQPRMPVLQGEINYEGILSGSWEDIQRMGFWTFVLSGATGHTYGANGVWQVNTREQPFGRSPHGRSWGDTPWEEAYRLPGSKQVGLGKRLLERFRWWEMTAHQEWVAPAWTEQNFFNCYAAGIAEEFRIIYTPRQWDQPLVKGIEKDITYRAFYFNPRDGSEVALGAVAPDTEGNWRPPHSPVVQDWVLVLTKA